MKILIVNSYDIYGGAARAAYRLHKGLQNFGIDSKMLVQKKFSDDDTVFTCENDRSQEISYTDKLALQNYPNKTKTLFSTAVVSNQAIVEYINNSDTDVVHLHWITNGFLSIDDIGKIKKPILWSLHDMWAFTGGCHYDEECWGYKKECGSCKVLQSFLQDDLSHKLWSIKKRVFSTCENLTIVGLSSWLAKAAQKSSLLANKPIFTLPNPINSDFFVAQKKVDCRNYFNLPQNKKLVLFGAMGATSDPRKGYEELTQALQNHKNENVEFVVFGNTQEEKSYDSHTTHFLGKIDDDVVLKKLYNAVDVMIVPSLQENLSNAIMESLSCGTPVVAFDIGGNSDMIEHKKNGYLAKPFDINDLAFGIDWVLSNKDYKQLCINARNKVVNTFSYDLVIPKYIDLYTNISTNKVQVSKEKYDYQTEILSEIIANIHSKQSQQINFSQLFNKLFGKIEELKQKNNYYALYGYGTIGKTIQALIPEKIVGYVDMADENNHPKNLKNMKYDKIIISVLGREKEIIKYLSKKLNIGEDKIITLEL